MIDIVSLNSQLYHIFHVKKKKKNLYHIFDQIAIPMVNSPPTGHRHSNGDHCYHAQPGETAAVHFIGRVVKATKQDNGVISESW